MSAAHAFDNNDYAVKDIGLANWGRAEITIAETEMPGLMAIREEFRQAQPTASTDSSTGADDDAPLGGDENTEDQLTADTAVERDALKALDPDDTPA